MSLYKLIFQSLNFKEALDKYNEADKQNREIKTFPVAGLITACREGITKNNTPFGILTLQDYSGSHEFPLFGNDYTTYRNFLKENLFVAIIVKTQERGSDRRYPQKTNNNEPKEFEAKIAKIELLENVADKLIKKLTIALQLGSIDSTLSSKLVEIFRNNPGHTELLFEVQDPETSSNLRLRANKAMINVTPQLIKELSIIQSNGSIKFWINDNKNIHEKQNTNEKDSEFQEK